MGIMIEVLKSIGENASPVEPEDYFREDGIRMCGKCHTPKERMIADMPNAEIIEKAFGSRKKIPSTCKCRAEEIAAAEREEKRREAEKSLRKRRQACFHTEEDDSYDCTMKSTFAVDDRANGRVSDAMKRYADGFADMMRSEDKYGLLIYGPFGTGKTFFAACVANELLKQGYDVEMTSFSRVVNTIQGMREGKQDYFDRLMRKDLLIFDDLGVERDSEYMQEQVSNIIDARYKSGKPMIVTTNIGMEDIKRPKNLTYQRMYDRLLEMCYPVKVDGKSRRRTAVAANYGARSAALGFVESEEKQ